MDPEECHIATIMWRMAPWGTQQLDKRWHRPPGCSRYGPQGSLKKAAVKAARVVIGACMEANHQGSNALVRRHTTCVPTRANR
jgi:hypothetical protein